MNACPGLDDLEHFLEERLDAEHQKSVAGHVASCPACQTTLDGLTRSEFSAPGSRRSLKPVVISSPSVSPSFLQQLKRCSPFPEGGSVRGSTLGGRTQPGSRSAGRARGASPCPALPGYEVLEELGRGGMGVVYRARQLALNRLVALKVLQGGAGAPPRERERLRKEAEAVAQLRHPNIVQVYDVGEFDTLPYLALEYLEAGSLAERLRGDPQPIPAAARLVETLARAIHHAHQLGIVHRDLKPENILLARVGNESLDEIDVFAAPARLVPLNDLEPRVTDFGLAKRLDEPSSKTASGEIVGTPSYMAPEQAGPGKQVGPLADVYALGAILYELLTGRPPFKGATAVETVVQLLHEEPVRPTSLRPDLPRDLETICLTCLAKDPARRYASAERLADDLGRFRRGRPIAARPIGPLERAVKWARRHPLPAGLLAGLVLVTTLGFSGVTWQWQKTAAARDTVLQEKQKTEREREQAEQARGEAASQRSQARTALYYSHIAQSQLSWRVNDYLGARGALTAYQPAPGERDRRGWEWYYLRGLYENDLLSFNLHRPGGGGSAAYSPRGDLLASVISGTPGESRAGDELRVWNAATGALVLSQLLDDGLNRLAFSRDGTRVALAGNGGVAVILDLATGRPLFRCRPHSSTISCICYSPDGGLVATGSWDRTLKIWDARTGKILRTYEGHTDRIQDLAFHPDGKQIATAGWDGAILLWNSVTGGPGTPLGEHVAAVFSVAYSPNGKLLASAAQNGNVKIWDLATGRVVQSLTGMAGAILNLAFSPDGRYLAYGGGDATVRVWDVESALERVIFRGHTAPVEFVDFSPDAQRLVSCSPKDGRVIVWDLTRHPEHAVFAHTDSDVEALAFHQDGVRVFSVTAKGKVQGWDRATGVLVDERVISRKTRSERTGAAAVFAPGAAQLAAPCAEDEGRLRVWDTATGKEVFALPSSPGRAICIRYSDDGRFLAAAHEGVGAQDRGEIRLWDAASGNRLATISPTRRVTNLAFHPQGDWLAWSGQGGVVELVHWRTGRKGPLLPRAAGNVHALAFGPREHILAYAGSEGRVVQIQRLKVGEDGRGLRVEGRSELPAPRTLWELTFSPDGSRLAGILRDVVKLWDIAAGVDILTLRGAPQRYWDAPFDPRIVFSPDGTQLAGSNWDESFSIWEARQTTDEDASETRREKRRQHADARATFWHLQEAEQCLRHRNSPAARFHLERLRDTTMPRPLEIHKSRLTRKLDETAETK